MSLEETAVKDISKIINSLGTKTAVFSKSGEEDITVKYIFTDIPDTIDLAGLESQIRTQVRTITISSDGLSKVPGVGWNVKINDKNYLCYVPPEVNENFKIASYKLRLK